MQTGEQAQGRTVKAIIGSLGFWLVFAVALPASAIDLTVTHWGAGMYGVPFAVAKEKGYFRDAGLDVTGFITSAGGGTTIRNALASEIPYGEVALPAAINAIQQGVELVIIHGGVVSVSDLIWVTRKDASGINSVDELKGKKLGYSSPKSTTDILSTIILDKRGIASRVERKSVGAISAGLTALREGGVDATYIGEPVWSKEKSNYRLAFTASTFLPRFTQTVGIVKADYAKKYPERIRGIINARKRGVEFILQNPTEAAAILAREYKLEPAVARSAIDTVMLDKAGYWSTGRFDYEGMNANLKGLIIVKAIEDGPFDWKKYVDESYLPADQRSK